MTARSEWPYLFGDKKTLFNEIFQGVEAIGNIAPKTGKILSESTNNQQKKRKELWQQQQSLFHYFQTFPVIFFGSFPNYGIAQERSLEKTDS